jgi:hypothetical protein
MTDVEQLLRETLADPRHRLDPGSGMYETVRERAHKRRMRVVQVASAFTVVVVIAGVATAIGTSSGHRRQGQTAASPSITPSPSMTPSPPTGQATSVNLGIGSTASMTVTSSGVFVARTQPNQLLDLSTADQSITRRVATPDAVDGTEADTAAGQVWTWSTRQATVDDSGQAAGNDSTSIHAYATSSFAMNGAVNVATYTFDAAAVDGQLWLATSDGLYVVTTAASGPVATKVISGPVFSVAVDAVRHRVLYGAQVSTTAAAPPDSLGSIAVHEIDAYTHAAIGVGTPLPIGKESIAIVGDQIWVGGYGSGSTPRLFHLDGSSLQPIATTGFGAGDPLALGPGAIVWPGASVVWVRSGGSEGLACVDPQSGALLEQWPAVQGPVASVRGHAYAASDGSLDQLSLAGDCTG